MERPYKIKKKKIGFITNSRAFKGLENEPIFFKVFQGYGSPVEAVGYLMIGSMSS